MIRLGPGGYPYHILLRRDAYIPVSSDWEYLLTLDEAASLIRNAGGIVSLAHYFTIKKIPLDALENILRKKRIDALETVYRAKPYQPTELPEIRDMREKIRQLARKTGALETGGPDAHEVEDIKSFLETNTLAAETIGMTEKIIASGKVDTRWSSF